MNKEVFVLLLETRTNALDIATKILSHGYKIESEICQQIFSIMRSNESVIEKEMNIKSWDDKKCLFGEMNTLTWALENLDTGQVALYSVIDNENNLDGTGEMEIQNFSQLYDVLMAEQED